MKLKFLIVGTGRCGTLHFARLMTHLGIPCGHESVFTPLGWHAALSVIEGKYNPKLSRCSKLDMETNKPLEEWVDVNDIVADSSYMAAPFLSHDDIEDISVIHLVRNPLKVISSFVLGFNYFKESRYREDADPWQNFIYSNLRSLSASLTQVERACLYYIQWNQMISDSRHYRKYLLHRVEDGITDELLEFLDVERKEPLETNHNSKEHENLKIRDIPTGSIKDKLIRIMSDYGYDSGIDKKITFL